MATLRQMWRSYVTFQWIYSLISSPCPPVHPNGPRNGSAFFTVSLDPSVIWGISSLMVLIPLSGTINLAGVQLWARIHMWTHQPLRQCDENVSRRDRALIDHQRPSRWWNLLLRRGDGERSVHAVFTMTAWGLKVAFMWWLDRWNAANKKALTGQTERMEVNTRKRWDEMVTTGQWKPHQGYVGYKSKAGRGCWQDWVSYRCYPALPLRFTACLPLEYRRRASSWAWVYTVTSKWPSLSKKPI